MRRVGNFEVVVYKFRIFKSTYIKICDENFVIKLYNYSRVALITSFYLLKCLKDIMFLAFSFIKIRNDRATTLYTRLLNRNGEYRECIIHKYINK
jgi:hypothetical protein